MIHKSDLLIIKMQDVFRIRLISALNLGSGGDSVTCTVAEPQRMMGYICPRG